MGGCIGGRRLLVTAQCGAVCQQAPPQLKDCGLGTSQLPAGRKSKLQRPAMRSIGRETTPSNSGLDSVRLVMDSIRPSQVPMCADSIADHEPGSSSARQCLQAQVLKAVMDKSNTSGIWCNLVGRPHRRENEERRASIRALRTMDLCSKAVLTSHNTAQAGPTMLGFFVPRK